MEGTAEPQPETQRDRSERDDNVIAFARRRPDTSPPDADEPPLRTVVGEVLRDERHAQERTLAAVAEGAAVSLAYLSEVERGTKEVSSDVLAAICDELDLPLVHVLERAARRLGGAVRRSGPQMLAA